MVRSVELKINDTWEDIESIKEAIQDILHPTTSLNSAGGCISMQDMAGNTSYTSCYRFKML